MSIGITAEVDEFGRSPRQPCWLVEPYISASTVTMVVGEPRSGKTTGLLTLAARVARHYHGSDTSMLHQAGVVYIGDGRPIDRDALNHSDKNGGDRRLLTLAQFGHALRWDVIYKLEKTVNAREARLLIVDEIDDLVGADAKRHPRSPVCNLVSALEAMALRTGLAVVIVSRHDSNELMGQVRSVLEVKRDRKREEFRLVRHLESNLGSCGPGWEFELAG